MRKIIIFIILIAFIFLSGKLLVNIFGVNPLIELKHKYYCVGESETGNYFKGNKCCGNLKAVLALTIVNNKSASDYGERCLVSGAGGTFLCTKCGNGVCEKIENVCNCPEDCFK